MIIDSRFDAGMAPFIVISDAATGEPFEISGDLLRVDTVRGIYRLVARDEDGAAISDEEGNLTWKEYEQKLVISPNPDLDPIAFEATLEWLENRERDGLPSFDVEAPTTLENAMHEVEIEEACEELGLGEEDRDFVMASYRFNSKLMFVIFEHGGDHRAYIETKLTLRAALRGEPTPDFPPRD